MEIALGNKESGKTSPNAWTVLCRAADVSPVALCKELYEKYRRVEYQSHDVQGVPLDRILEINPTRFIRKKTIAGWSKIKLRNFSRTNTINKTLPEGRNESIKT
ncbi:uncharacterized protein LOC144630263 isoform X2 [Oculina patagonica]